MPQFDALKEYLNRCQSSDILISFQMLDSVLSPEKLPIEARNRRKWWENTTSTPQGAAWLGAGWEVMNVNLIHGEITFSRENTKQPGASGRAVFPEPPPKPKP
jgi:hypothetical protein